MVRRHPHVFGDIKANSVEEVWANWEAIKREEKKARKKNGSALENIPKALPSLCRAGQVQRRADRLGFAWDDLASAWRKLQAELAELKELCSTYEGIKIRAEIGDLLFSIVNIARKLNIDAEEALRDSIKKFIQCFHYLEGEVAKNNQDLRAMSRAARERIWQEGKAKLAQQEPT
jgi:tetrapyrrole methylase family protein / MazG family protein